MTHRTGIYFLIKGDSIVYIGMTTKYPHRLKWHNSQKMDYDSVHFIECAADKLLYYEVRWIKRFKPIHNSKGKGRKPKAQKPKAQKPSRNRDQKIYKYMKLRKLTRLSKLAFGTYGHLSVGRMIELGKSIDLIQMYYKLSHITFFDDILDELGITMEWRIDKPNINRDKCYEFLKTFHGDEMARRKENKERKIYQESKQSLRAINIVSRSKQYNKNKNQGH